MDHSTKFVTLNKKLQIQPFYRRYSGATNLSSVAGSSGASDLSRSRSSHALKSREPSPLRSAATTSSAGDDKDGAALSSWARYLKNKYGNRSSKDSTRDTNTSTAAAGPSSSSSAGTSSSTARRLSLGLPLRQANEIHSSDDDSKNVPGSPTTTT